MNEHIDLIKKDMEDLKMLLKFFHGEYIRTVQINELIERIERRLKAITR